MDDESGDDDRDGLDVKEMNRDRTKLLNFLIKKI